MSNQIRILHAADFHLGSPFVGLSAPKAAIRQREQQVTFQVMIDLCREHKTQLLLLSGDILDQVRISSEQRRFILEALASIPHTLVVIAPGNHDPYTKDSPYAQNEWSENVHIFAGDFDFKYFPDLDVVIWGAAFTGNRACRSLCPPNFNVGDTGDYLKEDQTQIFPMTKDDIAFTKREISSETIHILLLHGELADNSGENYSYNPILHSWIEDSGADYAALGHVHAPSGIKKVGNTFFAYPGCPEARGFDEAGPRGVYMGSITKGKVDLEYIHINQRTYYCPNISVEGASTMQQIEDRVLSYLEESYGSHYGESAYRITLTGSLPADLPLHLPALKERLALTLFAVRLVDQTGSLVDLDLIAKETSLKGAFVQSMMKQLQAAQHTGALDQVALYEQALTLGLRAFEGEVYFNEDQ